MLLIKAIAAQNHSLWLRKELTDEQFQSEGKLWLDDTIAPWIARYGVAKVPEDVRRSIHSTQGDFGRPLTQFGPDVGRQEGAPANVQHLHQVNFM